ncbi:hypothetical protein L6241_10020 [Janibacter sp. Y6]|uniref:hypothetical protein n=1 Tax=Janibacter sp. Y6 TaxID=2913552 RepID=UPI0034A11B03
MSDHTGPERPPVDTDDVGPLEEFTTDYNGDYDPSWDNDPADDPQPEPATEQGEPDDYDPEV